MPSAAAWSTSSRAGWSSPCGSTSSARPWSSIRSFDPLTQRSLAKVDKLELMPVSEVLLDAAAIERFKTGYLRQFGAVTGDPLLESVEAGRAFPGMEHWLPLFHPDLVPLTDYLDAECEIGLDHLALDAVKARAALIGEHYEARLQPPLAGTSFGTAPYRALPPELLYLDEGGVERALAPHQRLQFSTFGPPPVPPTGIAKVKDLGGRPAHDFAAERANRSINLFDTIVAHLKELVAAGERPLLAAYSEGTLERLKQVLADHGFDTLTKVERWADVAQVAVAAIAVLPLERGFTAAGIHILGEHDLLGDRLTAVAKRSRRARRQVHPGHLGPGRGRSGRPRRARHRPVRRPGDAGDRRRAARLPEAALPRRRQAVRAGREPGRALALRPRRSGGGARPPGRGRLADPQGQGQGAHPRAGRRADQDRGGAAAPQGHGARPARTGSTRSSRPASPTRRPRTSSPRSRPCSRTWPAAGRWTG